MTTAFQSLFLWNSRPDTRWFIWRPWSGLVSILVFVELAPGRGGIRDSGAAFSVSILVFVELAPGRFFDRRLGGGRRSFNPCFCGTRARTAEPPESNADFHKFQSLFLWNSRPDVGEEITIALEDKFQSLFLWNSRPDPDRGYRCRARKLDVSILVFVELAPGR